MGIGIQTDTWAAWEMALGGNGVIQDRDLLGSYEANAGGWEHRLAGVLRPQSTHEVQAVVRIAAQSGTTLHPISCGRNWGYNSRLPAESHGTVLLDLSRMTNIRNEIQIGTKYPMAEIEPGVTQGQLAAHLQSNNLPLLFNATGAGPATSLLGNSLERGVGYFGLRTRDLSDLEVVLGNGEILRTGAGTLSSDAKTRLHYPFGLGPSLDSLFFQSNFGVVTSAAFRLIPRRACHVTLIAKLIEGVPLEAFVEALAHLRRQELVQSVLHVGSPNRVRVTLSPLVYRSLVCQGREPSDALRREVENLVSGQFQQTWTAVGPVYGTDAQVQAAREAIDAYLAGVAQVQWITESDLEQSEGLARTMTQPLVDLCQGLPTDGALDSPHWSLGKDPPKNSSGLDETDTGVRFCSPALPLDGEIVSWTIEKQKEILAKHDFEPYLTLNLIDDRSALLITNIAFDKAEEGASNRAHIATQEVMAAWAAEGIFPYRLGLHETSVLSRDPVHNACIDGLKKVFDPKNVFGSGRYQRVREA